MWMNRYLRPVFAALMVVLGLYTVPAAAQTCSAAATQGTAPAAWETYCWLDFSTYDDTIARSASGQNMSFALTDGSVLSLNVKATTATATAFLSKTAPSWTGAAVGNTAFLGIPGKPILYTTAAGAKSLLFSNIFVTPPPGAPAVTTYAFVAADAESTNQSENLQFVTDGGNWVILDQVNPISGSAYPTITGENTNTFTETGIAGTVGGYIVGSSSPQTVTANMQAGGLQGAMFAVRFASIRLKKAIVGARVNAADQFTFSVTANSTPPKILATGTTSGTTNGPFNAAVVTLASGVSLTLSEAMATGSVSTLAQYNSTLNCVNGTSSSTPLPNNVQTTNYNFGALQFGDAVQCTFTNAAYPHIRVNKALGSNRRFATDQFTVRIMNGATVAASATTTGTTNTVSGGDTGLVQLNPGTGYTLDEIMSGPGNLAQYTSAMSCTNGVNGISTSFPTSVPGVITPVLGDVISCTITNTRIAGNANLVVTKTSTVISDPVSTANPKAIPGAIVRYSITVQNTGNLSVDANSLVMEDPLPANFTLDASTPFTFTNGTVPSGLNTFNQSSMVTYSSTGSAPYSQPLGSGYNAAIRGFRFAPSGTMAPATTSGPSSFTITYSGRID
jgi:uncharacterized repeat protein (TIGR01451 family)